MFDFTWFHVCSVGLRSCHSVRLMFSSLRTMITHVPIRARGVVHEGDIFVKKIGVKKEEVLLCFIKRRKLCRAIEKEDQIVRY